MVDVDVVVEIVVEIAGGVVVEIEIDVVVVVGGVVLVGVEVGIEVVFVVVVAVGGGMTKVIAICTCNRAIRKITGNNSKKLVFPVRDEQCPYCGSYVECKTVYRNWIPEHGLTEYGDQANKQGWKNKKEKIRNLNFDEKFLYVG